MRNILLSGLLGVLVGISAGCTKPGETTAVAAATGGAIGAGVGAMVGNQGGDPGTGLVVGALAGSGTGALVGNALEAQNNAIKQQDEAIENQERMIAAQNAQIEELRRRSQDRISFRDDLHRALQEPARPVDNQFGRNSFENNSLQNNSLQNNTMQYNPNSQGNNQNNNVASLRTMSGAIGTESSYSRPVNNGLRLPSSGSNSGINQQPGLPEVGSRSNWNSQSGNDRFQPQRQEIPVLNSNDGFDDRASLKMVPEVKDRVELPNLRAADIQPKLPAVSDAPQVLKRGYYEGDAEEEKVLDSGITERSLAASSRDDGIPVMEQGIDSGAREMAGQQQASTIEVGGSPECQSAFQEIQSARLANEVSDQLFHYRRALRLCPENAGYHNSLGELYLSMKRLDDARYEFSEALKLDPNHREARSNISSLSTRY